MDIVDENKNTFSPGMKTSVSAYMYMQVVFCSQRPTVIPRHFIRILKEKGRKQTIFVASSINGLKSVSVIRPIALSYGNCKILIVETY